MATRRSAKKILLMKSVKRTLLIALFFLLTVSICSAQGIPRATTPEEVGLSKEHVKILAFLKK